MKRKSTKKNERTDHEIQQSVSTLQYLISKQGGVKISFTTLKKYQGAKKISFST